MNDAFFINRCIDLALLGAGAVAPNPMVGAVLVYNGRVIGEGYHRRYGEAHAEVNCISSVKEEDRNYIASSTMYVSLEPCAHYGKTPPCADLIIKQGIKKVVIGCSDSFAQVNGAGIRKLRDAGIEVFTGLCEEACRELNKRFFTFHEKRRPYIILKWAQSMDGFIGSDSKRLFITNDITNRLTHKWRSEEAAIIVGTNTALIDDPSLTNRYYFGKNPLRMFVDRHLSLKQQANLLNNETATVIFNATKNLSDAKTDYAKIFFEKDVEERILTYCFEKKIQSIIIEGGAKFLQSFIHAGYWDECRLITNTALQAFAGIKAPALKEAVLLRSEEIFSDRIDYYKKA
ncbi:bifunctional diaminohydroxyphosphoribosylaminopyrimidine deaminase/5-amino-6-(5-phosphoribosylamino)uracil reductase RibD [Haoranjiania flava]|uniref:Riboflavin biosynthesis protein RibD n=1 Tax=Haoranjiania flava TaxID=1856322 RepID=A0AAE3LL86_9BACT|nr:bifunctional diaminohydroxyphosphoribosylaminopyrimidine deaminase/5-amino-6-(5-phosphoribosylamino)uracil reductase RibD [Haoranjiania flava]MCU7695114.1 bifunctional diaminohydroxyphosphoribosylaminopyrimidine deaminase/5-amino-6-(5-phosphoribosylamino)uracil reductase RibD [Haoranjiania flava]